jgi:hypothetical protein
VREYQREEADGTVSNDDETRDPAAVNPLRPIPVNETPRLNNPARALDDNMLGCAWLPMSRQFRDRICVEGGGV